MVKKAIISFLAIILILPTVMVNGASVTTGITSVVTSKGERPVIVTDTKNSNITLSQDTVKMDQAVQDGINIAGYKAMEDVKYQFKAVLMDNLPLIKETISNCAYAVTKKKLDPAIIDELANTFITQNTTAVNKETQNIWEYIQKTYGGTLKNTLKQYVDEKKGQISLRIDEGSAIIVNMITQPLYDKISDTINSSVPVLGNLVTNMAKKYQDSLGWDKKLANEVKKRVGLETSEVVTKKFKWNEAIVDSAISAVAQYSNDFVQDFFKDVSNNLFGHLNIDVTGTGFDNAIAEWAMASIAPRINEVFQIAAMNIKGDKKVLEELKIEVEGKTKEQIKAEAEELRKQLKKDTQEEIARLNKKALASMSESAGLLAGKYASKLYDKLAVKIDQLGNEWGSVGRSLSNTINKEIGGWLKEQVTNNVTRLCRNLLLGENGKLKFEKLDLKQIGVSFLMDLVMNNKELKKILEILTVNVGGIILKEKMWYDKTYAETHYLFMATGGTLMPTHRAEDARSLADKYANEYKKYDVSFSKSKSGKGGGTTQSKELSKDEMEEMGERNRRWAEEIDNGNISGVLDEMVKETEGESGDSSSGGFGQEEAGAGYHSKQFSDKSDVIVKYTPGDEEEQKYKFKVKETKDDTQFIPMLVDGSLLSAALTPNIMVPVGVKNIKSDSVGLDINVNYELEGAGAGANGIVSGEQGQVADVSVSANIGALQADSTYILNEMIRNRGGDGYVQRAFSRSSYCNGKGTNFSETLQTDFLLLEAKWFQKFRIQCELTRGFQRAIKDLTTVAKAKYDNNQATFILGPFRINYIRDYYPGFAIAQKKEFGSITNMRVYDQDGNELAPDTWNIVYSEDGDFNHNSRFMDEDYQFPYPKENFYIQLYQYFYPNVTSISRIEFDFQELRSETIALSYMQMFFDLKIINVPRFKGTTGYPAFIPIWGNTIYRIPIPHIDKDAFLCVVYTDRKYKDWTQTIQLHKKENTIPGYEWAEYTTTSSVKSNGTRSAEIVNGDELNSLMSATLSGLGGMLTPESTDWDKVSSNINNAWSTIAARGGVGAFCGALGSSVSRTTAYLEGAAAIANACGKTKFASVLSAAGALTDTSKSYFSRAISAASILTNNPNIRKWGTLISNVIDLANSKDISDVQKIGKILQSTAAITGNQKYGQLINFATGVLDGGYGEEVMKLMEKDWNDSLSREQKIAFLKQQYPNLSDARISEIISQADSLKNLLYNSGKEGQRAQRLITEVASLQQKAEEIKGTVDEIKRIADYGPEIGYLLGIDVSNSMSTEEKQKLLQAKYPRLDDKTARAIVGDADNLRQKIYKQGKTGATIKAAVETVYPGITGKTPVEDVVDVILDGVENNDVKQGWTTYKRIVDANSNINKIKNNSDMKQEEKDKKVKEEKEQMYVTAAEYTMGLFEGNNAVNTIKKVYTQYSKTEGKAIDVFQETVRHMEEKQIQSMVKELGKATDGESLLDMLNVYYERYRNAEVKKEFVETTQRGELFDSTPYEEYSSKFNIRSVKRPEGVYYMDDDVMGLTLSFAGVVWKDGHEGLERTYDGIRNANANGDLELGIKGVEVQLINAEKYPPQIGRMKVNGAWAPAITYTDEGGYYHLEEVEAGRYYVKFIYDGETYMATTEFSNGEQAIEEHNTDQMIKEYNRVPDTDMYQFANNSKAAENKEERQLFNDTFYEIKNGEAISKYGVKTPLKYTKDGGISKLITTDSQNRALPEFAMSATTKELGISYPIDDRYTLDNQDTGMLIKDGNGAIKSEYRRTGEYMYHINLGLVERSKADTAVVQDVYKVTTTVNQKKEEYIYNQRGPLGLFEAKQKQTSTYRNIKYERKLYNADYQLRLQDYQMNEINKLDRNGDDKTAEIEKIREIKKIQYNNGEGLEERAFVTYKITLANEDLLQSICINELTDYYDTDYKMVDKDIYQEIQDENGVVHSTLVAQQSFFILEETTTAKQYKLDWEQVGKVNGLNCMKLSRLDDSKTRLEDIIIPAHGKVWVFITFEINKSNDRAIERGNKENIIEISNYTTIEKGLNDKEHSIGLIDKDSEPNNISIRTTNGYEDDTDAAPLIDFELYSSDIRYINGFVWNDEDPEKQPYEYNRKNQVVGNGLREENEELINGVRVQLVEVIKDPRDGKEYEYVWREMFTGEDTYKYIGSAGNLSNTNRGKKIDANYKTGSIKDGEYRFCDYIAGNFIIRFIYGDTPKTYLAEGSKNENGEGLNKTSYNGQDYKSTRYLDGVGIFKEWIDLAGITAQDKLASDAKDDTARRLKLVEYGSTIQNDKAEIMASFDARKDKHDEYYTRYKNDYKYIKDYYNDELHAELRNNTWMFADTAKMNIQVEFNETMSDGLENLTYKINNMDFGLKKRPETRIELQKEIVDITVTLASGETIINTARGLNQNVNGVPTKMSIRENVPGNYYKRNNLKYDYREGKIHIYMDAEIMQGTKVIVTYKLTVINNSDYDYIGEDGGLGYAYYTGEVLDSDKIVTTTVDKIIVYVDNSLTFRKVDSEDWSLIETMPEFTTDKSGNTVLDRMTSAQFIQLMIRKYGTKYVKNNLTEVQENYQKYLADKEGKIPEVSRMTLGSYEEVEQERGIGLTNYKVLLNMQERDMTVNNRSIGYLNQDLKFEKTKSGKTEREPITQVIVTKALEEKKLKPGEQVTMELVLSKTLSPQDDEDTLTYSNVAEILQYSNTMGRRDMDAIPGNQEPNQYKAEYYIDENQDKIYYTEDQKHIYEYDTAFTERILITPPTGGNQAYYIVLPIVVLVVLAGGIIIIKRKVLDR